MNTSSRVSRRSQSLPRYSDPRTGTRSYDWYPERRDVLIHDRLHSTELLERELQQKRQELNHEIEKMNNALWTMSTNPTKYDTFNSLSPPPSHQMTTSMTSPHKSLDYNDGHFNKQLQVQIPQQKKNGDMFSLDLPEFSPDEIRVGVDGHQVKIQAKHQENGPGTNIRKEYNRTIYAPGMDLDKLQGTYDDYGTLTLKAPRRQRSSSVGGSKVESSTIERSYSVNRSQEPNRYQTLPYDVPDTASYQTNSIKKQRNRSPTRSSKHRRSGRSPERRRRAASATRDIEYGNTSGTWNPERSRRAASATRDLEYNYRSGTWSPERRHKATSVNRDLEYRNTSRAWSPTTVQAAKSMDTDYTTLKRKNTWEQRSRSLPRSSIINQYDDPLWSPKSTNSRGSHTLSRNHSINTSETRPITPATVRPTTPATVRPTTPAYMLRPVTPMSPTRRRHNDSYSTMDGSDAELAYLYNSQGSKMQNHFSPQGSKMQNHFSPQSPGQRLNFQNTHYGTTGRQSRVRSRTTSLGTNSVDSVDGPDNDVKVFVGHTVSAVVEIGPHFSPDDILVKNIIPENKFLVEGRIPGKNGILPDFRREFMWPVPVNPQTISAAVRGGILKITAMPM